jgi:hypothetical protein
MSRRQVFLHGFGVVKKLDLQIAPLADPPGAAACLAKRTD